MQVKNKKKDSSQNRLERFLRIPIPCSLHQKLWRRLGEAYLKDIINNKTDRRQRK